MYKGACAVQTYIVQRSTVYDLKWQIAEFGTEHDESFSFSSLKIFSFLLLLRNLSLKGASSGKNRLKYGIGKFRKKAHLILRNMFLLIMQINYSYYSLQLR